MTAAATIIADDIVSQYQTAFPGCSAARAYVPTWDLGTLDAKPLIQVAPNGQEIELQSRGGGVLVEYSYMVAVGAKVVGQTTDALDSFADLLESLMDYWQDKTITGRQERAIKWELQVWPDIDQLNTKSMFLGAFVITFQGTR